MATDAVKRMTSVLCQEGFLQATPGYKAKGFYARGLPRYSITSAADAIARMEQQVFHPLAHIRHHVRSIGTLALFDYV
jgi:hypothetical protein